MEVILNIGLAREGNSNIGQGTVMREVIGAFGAAAFEFKHSDTELTCIASVGYDGLMTGLGARLHHLCGLLGQDCIAIYFPERRRGELVGPRAAAWGDFNPTFFIMPGGERLATPLQNAA